MCVVRPATFLDLPCLSINLIVRYDRGATSLLPHLDCVACELHVEELASQFPSNNQYAAASVDPIPEGQEVWIDILSEEQASCVGVDDGAHRQSTPKKRRCSSRKKLR